MSIELVSPPFVFGDEGRLFDFISGLNSNDKIALISHIDLDGVTAAKLVTKVINPQVIRLVNYEELNQDLIDDLKNSQVNKIFITDLFAKDLNFVKNLEKFAEIVIIDHHLAEYDLNSEKTIFFNSQGFCASYLCYYLFSKIKDVSTFDWLVACASVADWLYFINSEWIGQIYKKYGDEFFIDGKEIRKTGKFWDLQWILTLAFVDLRSKDKILEALSSIGEDFGEIGNLAENYKKVQDEIDDGLKRFEIEKKQISGGYFWEFTPHYRIGSIVSSLLSSKYYNNTIIIAREEGEFYNFSARRGDKKEDMNALLGRLTQGLEGASGGGHVPAAGGHVLLKDKDEFKKRLGVF